VGRSGNRNTTDCETPAALDLSLCHTGWALYDRAYDRLAGKFTYGVIEQAKDVTETLPRMEHILEEVVALLPGSPATWPSTVFVLIEGLAFSARGDVMLQLAGLGYLVRRALWQANIAFKDVTPNQAKKFLTGKGNCDKNLVLLKVFQKYGIECEDDNVADAVNLNMIGRALLGWTPVSNEVQRAVIADLSKPPKVKGTRKKSKAA